MNRSICFCLLFGSIFAIFNCFCVDQLDMTPRAVVMLASVDDTCRVEEGIDAIPESDAIRIEWVPSQEVYVASYEVFRSTDPREGFRSIGSVTADEENYVDAGVTLNRRYFYYVVAVSDEGLRSEPSDTLSYLLMHKPTGLDPAGVTAADTPDFSWRDPNQAAAFVVRLVDEATEAIVWIRWVWSSYSGDREGVRFNDDGSATVQALRRDTDYRWRVDIVGPEVASGAESGWVGLRME